MDKTELLKEYDDGGNKIKPRSFVSFYDYNRTTCGWLKYIFGADIHTYRRIVWIIVFCTGFIYSVLMKLIKGYIDVGDGLSC